MNQKQILTCFAIFIIITISAFATLLFEFNLLWQETEVYWLILLIVACCFPGVFAFLTGNFDPFEPLYPMAIATFIYFGLMVIVLVQTDSFWMLGINYRSEVPKALFLALLALVSFCIAYYGSGRNADQLPKRPIMTKADLKNLRPWSMGMLAFFGSLFLLWIVIAQVPLWSLWIFGEATYNIWKTESMGIQIGYLFCALEAFPACALLLIAARPKRHWPLTSIFLLAGISLLFAGLGERYRLLLLFASSMVFFYLDRGKRPTVWQIALVGFIVFYFIVGAIGYVRDPENPERGLAAVDLTRAWLTFVKGSDIATTTAAYVHWTPVFGYEWGKNFLQVLIFPIPSAFWPGKYQFMGESPIDVYKGDIGAAAAFFIEFYVSFGPAGVVIGMAVVGWLCRRIYDNYQANPRDPLDQISLALLWAFLFHLYGRNLFSLMFYSALYIYSPVWISRWLATRYRRNQKACIYPKGNPE